MRTETNRFHLITQLTVNHPLAVFFTLAYALAWSVFLPMIFFHRPPEFIIIATFAPTVAALVTHRLATGNYRAFRIRSTWPRTLSASATGFGLIVVAYVILPALTTANPGMLHWGVLTSLGVYHYSTLLGGPLGEEPGWRGYALPRLEARFGPVRASLLLAFLWTGWHIPLFFYPGWTSVPAWVYLLILTGTSFILTYSANLSRFGVVAPIATHAAFNTVPSFLNRLLADSQPRAQIPFELVLALSGLAIGLIIIIATRGRLAYHMDEDLKRSLAEGNSIDRPWDSSVE
jgi:membrane protease YdiL (CAAX protease family)